MPHEKSTAAVIVVYIKNGFSNGRVANNEDAHLQYMIFRVALFHNRSVVFTIACSQIDGVMMFDQISEKDHFHHPPVGFLILFIFSNPLYLSGFIVLFRSEMIKNQKITCVAISFFIMKNSPLKQKKQRMKLINTL